MKQEKNFVERLIEKAEKKTEVEIGGEKVSLLPLTNREILKFTSLAEKGNVEGMMIGLIKMTLVKVIPDVTEEQIGKMPYLFDFVYEIAKLNHLERFFPTLFQKGSEEFPKMKALMPSVKGSTVKGRVDLSQHN